MRASTFNPDSLCFRYNLYSRLCAPEKLYLHIDRAAFVPGETIWFTGYLQNASEVVSQPVSNFIYVELLDKEGIAIQVVKIKKNKDNVFPGYISIPDNTLSGTFTLRAYTQWQLNDDPAYLFHQTIMVSPKNAKAAKLASDASVKAKGEDPAVEIFLRRREDFCYMGACAKQALPYDGKAELFLRSNKAMVRLATMQLTSEIAWVRIATPNLPRGLNSFLFYDPEGKLLAERLFYVYDTNPVLCSVQSTLAGASTAVARAVAKNTVTVTDSEGKGLNGHFSVSVAKGSIAAQKQGVLSYMELSSEMTEAFDEPDSYFDCTVPLAHRSTLLDMELKERHWNFYRMKDIFTGRFIVNKFKEYVQTISGSIERLLSQKMPKNFTFSLFVPSMHITKFLRVDQAKTFTIDSLDFPENTTFMISINRDGGSQYEPKWSGDSFAPRYHYLADLALREEKSEAFIYDQKADTLEAAVVTGEIMEPYSALSTSVPAIELEIFKTKTLIQFLLMKYPYFRYVDGMMITAKLMRGTTVLGVADEGQDAAEEKNNAMTAAEMFGEQLQGSRVKLIINDTEEEWWIFEEVYLEDIAAIAYSKEPDARFNAPGGIVEIKMKPGFAQRKDNQTDRNLLVFVPLGYQQPDYFNSPRYDLGAPDDGFDHRNTIFWSPSVAFKNGRAEFYFCDTDQMQHPYEVRIEGVTSDGKPFSCHTLIGE